MERRFYIDYENTPFLRTSKTGSHPNRLNWRCEILLTRNQEAIKGKRILDIASHDGRFSYACLELGASHVTGVEGRDYLVKLATDNLIGLGYKPEHFRFIQDDVFDYLPRVKPKEFDTILCLGFFYHTIRQIELLREIKRIQPMYFVLDTQIARDVSDNPFTLLSLISRLRFKHLVRIPVALRKAKEIASSERGKPCLVFKLESHVREEATIDPIDVIAWPTKSFIELMLRSYGFGLKQLRWNNKEIANWTAIEEYEAGTRVSYIAHLLE